MKKNTVHRILNPILFVLFINQAVTALFNEKFSLQTFDILHKGGGMIFIALLLLHFILNFNWVKANYFSR